MPQLFGSVYLSASGSILVSGVDPPDKISLRKISSASVAVFIGSARTGSKRNGPSFFGLFTRKEISHIRIWLYASPERYHTTRRGKYLSTKVERRSCQRRSRPENTRGG